MVHCVLSLLKMVACSCTLLHVCTLLSQSAIALIAMLLHHIWHEAYILLRFPHELLATA